MPDGESERTLAECLACGSAYAAKKWPDGAIQPIGSTSCECGSTEFQVIEDSTTTVLREEKPD
nr:hypothetical protein [Natronococcus sp. AD5]